MKSLYKSMIKKPSKLLLAGVLGTSLVFTGCVSGGGLAQNAMLGAASGAATQIGGNSDDVKNAAAVGALLGILGSLGR